MSWRNWLIRRRARSERAVLQRRGVWGDTAETLQWLDELLQSCSFHTYKVTKAERLFLTTMASNVDELVQRLLRASWIVSQHEDVDRFPNTTIQRVSLDQYLVTESRLPIRPEEVVKVLHAPLSMFLHTLQVMHSIDDPRSNYYRRQYGQLMQDLRMLIEALLSVSDQGPLKDLQD